ncbi:response regulator [Dyella sp.]|uniref:response regulator n=1 Tax=Dyella sp. TaxID=1869338 RepID=UPI002ED10B07
MTSPIENSSQTLALDAPHRVLVADDDPASLLFLSEVLRKRGLEVTGCPDGTSAIAQGKSQAFRMLILDCRMPGAGAIQVLTELRAHGYEGAAVATSAELDEPTRMNLFAHGFHEVLLKPCQPAELERILGLVDPQLAGQPLLDDAQALSSSGDSQVMKALRSLMREELLLLEKEWAVLVQDRSRLRERLHRLLASCGFCGTASLAAQTQLLQQRLLHGQRLPKQLTDGFQATVQATIKALQG